jgi:hypothetical protein
MVSELLFKREIRRVSQLHRINNLTNIQIKTSKQMQQSIVKFIA